MPPSNRNYDLRFLQIRTQNKSFSKFQKCLWSEFDYLSSEILEIMWYSSYVPPSYYTDVATCCVMRILFPQHKSTYCKEVGAKFTWEFISRFKINSTSCSYIAAKNEWQSSIVQELRGIVMDATKTCLCNSYRKYLCMKNYFVLNFSFLKELIFQGSLILILGIR